MWEMNCEPMMATLIFLLMLVLLETEFRKWRKAGTPSGVHDGRHGAVQGCRFSPSVHSRSQSKVQLGCSQRSEAGKRVETSRRRKVRNGPSFLAPETSRRISFDERISATPRLRPNVGLDPDLDNMG